jgi:hypothetical protein
MQRLERELAGASTFWEVSSNLIANTTNRGGLERMIKTCGHCGA